MGQQFMRFFSEMVEWSGKKDSYSIDDFIMSKNVTEQQMKTMTKGKSSCFLAVGKATCQCLDNSYQAWKSKEISDLQFSRYLIQSKLFSGDVESFDRLQQEVTGNSCV
jgi:hypothetical protein